MVLNYLPTELKVLYRETANQPHDLVRAIEIVEGYVLNCNSAKNKELLPDYYYYNKMGNSTLISQKLTEAINKQLSIQKSYKVV